MTLNEIRHFLGEEFPELVPEPRSEGGWSFIYEGRRSGLRRIIRVLPAKTGNRVLLSISNYSGTKPTKKGSLEHTVNNEKQLRKLVEEQIRLFHEQDEGPRTPTKRKSSNAKRKRPRRLPSQEAADLIPPDRILTRTYRILRDTGKSRWVKEQHNFECQVCGKTIELLDGSRYAEAHHIQPLGGEHKGPDVIGNILCLCPNHHAEFDLGVTLVNLSTLSSAKGHDVDQKYVDYHNQKICKSKRG